MVQKRRNRRFVPKRRPKKRGNTIQKFRPKFNLNTLQLANVRPSTMKIPIECKLQFYCKALASQPGGALCLYLNMSAPIQIAHVLGGSYQETARTTTGGNAQELATLAGMYQHYCVLGSKAEYSLKFLQHRTDNTSGGTIPNNNPNELVMGVYSGITKTNSYPTGSTQPNELIDAHNFREQRVLCGSQQRSSSTGINNAVFIPSGGTKRINGQLNYSPRKILGVKDVADNSSLKGSLTTPSAPAEETFGCISVQHAYDTSLGGAGIHADSFNDFYIDVKMTYLLQVSEPSVTRGNNLMGRVADPRAIHSSAVPFGGGTA